MNISALCSLKFYKRVFDSYGNYWKVFHSRTANVCVQVLRPRNRWGWKN